MGGILGGLFDSNSSSSTRNEDNQIGATGGNAVRAENAANGTINIGSDQVATAAINAISTNATQFEQVISQGLTAVQNALTTAANNAAVATAAAQQQSNTVATNATTTPAESFTTLVAIAAVVALGYWVWKR